MRTAPRGRTHDHGLLEVGVDAREEEAQDPTGLARQMARLFPSLLETLEVLRGAGLDLRDVPLTGRRRTLVSVWKAAIAAADAQQRLPQLLMAARGRYGHKRVIMSVDHAEPVRTFIMLIALLGVTLGAMVGVGWFMVSLDSRTWTRTDVMELRFEDLEVRALFRDREPPGWAFWLPRPPVADVPWPLNVLQGGLAQAEAPPEPAVAQEQPARPPAALPAEAPLPGIPPFDPAAMPSRPSLALPAPSPR